MSQNFRVATWIPEGNLDPNRIVITQGATPANKGADTQAVDPASLLGGVANVNGAQVNIQTTEPGNPNNGDTWVDISDPTRPSIKVYSTPAGQWIVVADIPEPTAEGQVLVSGKGPNFDWGAGTIDGSRY